MSQNRAIQISWQLQGTFLDTNGPIAWHAEHAMDDSGNFPKHSSDQTSNVELCGWTETSFAEVDFQMQEGIVRIPLSNLLKEFHPSEFVEVMGRPFQEQGGWVEGGWDNIVHVAVENRSDDATEVCNVKVGLFFNSWHLN